MTETLSRKIPNAIYRRSSQTAILLSMALFTFLFIVVFRPFDIYGSIRLDSFGYFPDWHFTEDESFYAALTFMVLTGLAAIGISRAIMVRYNRRYGITYSKFILWNLLEFLILAVIITLCSSAMFHHENLLTVFVKVFFRTTCILLIPYGYSFVYIMLVEKVQQLKRLNQQIENDEAAQQRAYVLFNDDKGLRLSVKRDSLLMIESADNYVCVWYLNNGAVKKTMVRNTMKRVAEQLGDDNIRRCHRSYMVNMDRVKVLRREKESVFIEFGLDGVPDIPISKTYAKSITSWLMK